MYLRVLYTNPLDLMMRPAPVDPAGRKCDHSEHPRSKVGAGPMFLEAPKNHQKKTSIFGGIFGPLWLPKWLHFCFILHLFFGIFFDEKMIPIFPCFSPPSGCPDPRICWQGQYFHGVGASRTSFNLSSKLTPKSSPNCLKMAPEMYQKTDDFFIDFFTSFVSLKPSKMAPKMARKNHENSTADPQNAAGVPEEPPMAPGRPP